MINKNWLLGSITKVVRNGRDTSFWSEEWSRGRQYSRLFKILLDKEAKVVDLRWREEG